MQNVLRNSIQQAPNGIWSHNGQGFSCVDGATGMRAPADEHGMLEGGLESLLSMYKVSIHGSTAAKLHSRLKNLSGLLLHHAICMENGFQCRCKAEGGGAASSRAALA
jgi:hypothetical protein